MLTLKGSLQLYSKKTMLNFYHLIMMKPKATKSAILVRVARYLHSIPYRGLNHLRSLLT